MTRSPPAVDETGKTTHLIKRQDEEGATACSFCDDCKVFGVDSTE